MKINYCDALVIGGGLAGLRAAVAAQKKGLSTIVLSLVPVKRSHSAAAQGGMQASLGNSKNNIPRDSFKPSAQIMNYDLKTKIVGGIA